MNKKLKCQTCGRFFDSVQVKKISGKYYCQNCYEDRQKEVEQYKKLCDYIFVKIEEETPNMPFLTTQIKRFKEQGYSYAQILAVLKYMYEILEDVPPIDNSSGIALVPRYFQEAKEFYICRQESSKGLNISKILNNPIKIIEIKRSDIISKEKQEEEKRKKQENKAIIDLNTIEDDGYIDEFAKKLVDKQEEIND